MARATPSGVKGICKVRSGVDLMPYITPANELTTELCSTVKKSDGTTAFHTDERLALIETYLAAHFYTIDYRRTTQEQAGSVMASYVNKVDLRLQATEFGQQAMILDTSGALAALNNSLGDVKAQLGGGLKKKVAWLGSDD